MNDPLYVDRHEPTKIKIALKKLGIPIEVKTLKVGDYQFYQYIVERKSVSDLLNSIYQGRLYNQLYNLMKLEGYFPLLFVVGKIPPTQKWKKKKGKTVRENMSFPEIAKKEKLIISNLSLAFTSFHIPVYICKDNNQFVKYIENMYYRCNKKIKGLKPVSHRQSRSIEDIKSDIWTCFPNIGRTKANFLSKEYKLKDISNMSIERLSKIKHISEKLAEIIYNVFTT